MEYEIEAICSSLRFNSYCFQQRPFSLLILEDWLQEPISAPEARDLLDLLDLRYRKTSCLFATQLPVDQWHQQIQDPTLADAILDRIVHLTFPVKSRKAC